MRLRVLSLLAARLLVFLFASWLALPIALCIADTSSFAEISTQAEQGNATAQSNLGTMYTNGQGVTRDYVESYVWYSLASAQGDADAQRLLNLIEHAMTSDQIAEAQKRAAAWRPSGLDHMKVYTCGKKFLLTSTNSARRGKSISKIEFSSETRRIAVAASP